MANGIEKIDNAQVYQPANTLYSRTFIALLIAQFFAAFNDQAIHASAMFFAINKSILNEAQAISLLHFGRIPCRSLQQAKLINILEDG